MTERGQPTGDRATACPFVAFEDDRDARADRPDHRHRCYADLRPAPRALAHQAAYCLSPSFPTCPTFQDWARREAAAARPGRSPEPDPDVDRPAVMADHAHPATGGDPWADPTGAEPDPGLPPRRPMHRDWAAPPHWVDDASEGAAGAAAAVGASGVAGVVGPGAPAGGGGAHGAADDAAGSHPPPFLAGREPLADRADVSDEGPPEGRGLADSTFGRGESSGPEPDEGDWESMAAASAPSRTFGRPAGQSRTGGGATGSDRGRRLQPEAPAWERPRRYEAYPTLKTRVGMPSVQPLAGAAVAIVIAALALFFIPPLLLNLGSGSGPANASASASAAAASAAASVSPTPPPPPTPLVYVVKSGDTLSKIAKKYGVTVDQLVAANKATIKDPDKIKLGDKITIPTSAPSGLPDAGSPSPS